jgi:hypothetical protein
MSSSQPQLLMAPGAVNAEFDNPTRQKLMRELYETLDAKRITFGGFVHSTSWALLWLADLECIQRLIDRVNKGDDSAKEVEVLLNNGFLDRPANGKARNMLKECKSFYFSILALADLNRDNQKQYPGG